ncbi:MULTISPECIES: recombinase family protein [Amycolatopsis]|uniref:Recombinase n=1 Tax=Amycolatopsis saalfeldensis TaxID=394193 RepID=A0A1H8YQS5_9PSEU|nr:MULTISPECIES: recombinase family protein [Amycolatopsis]SEP54517.1 Recombinase [Amycolatopsis saalfeldensis]
MNTTTERGHRPHRVPRRGDPVLYPGAQDRAPDSEFRSRRQRLREYLAERLTAPYDNDGGRREIADRGIRAYQRELARRSRGALRQRTREGWWHGPAPYGYTLQRHRAGDRRPRLVIDELRAPVVPLIFTWSLHGNLSDRAIARRLTEQQHPLPVDPVSGWPRAWSWAIVRTVLTNPAYLGYVTRDRTVRGAAQPPECWTWSRQRSHPALILPAAFWAVHTHRSREAPACPDTGTTAFDSDHQEAA